MDHILNAKHAMSREVFLLFFRACVVKAIDKIGILSYNQSWRTPQNRLDFIKRKTPTLTT